MKHLTTIVLLAAYFSLKSTLFAWTSSNEGVCYTMDTLTILSDDIVYNNSTQMYDINTSIIILENDSLFIMQGETLNFLGYYYIRIYGYLNAVGTEVNKIKLGNPNFTFGNGNYWFGIQFYDTSPNGESKLKYCDIKGAVFIDESLWLCQEPALLCKNSSPFIDHCRISKMDSSCETDGGIGILCIGLSNAIISYTSFEELHNSIALLCFPDFVDNLLTFPSPLIYGCNIMRSVEGYFSLPTYYDVVIYQGGFIDNCYLGATINAADTTLGYPIDTIGDGICTTSSTFELRPRFMLVDGLAHPRSDSLITGLNENETEILPTTTNYLVLNNNYPNPFSGFTTIGFDVAINAATISLMIYDSKGNLVKHLINHKTYPHGSYTLNWHGDTDSGTRAGEGIYFYKLLSDNRMLVKKAIVVK
jgi:hypothetical protein